jgi:kynureninase
MPDYTNYYTSKGYYVIGEDIYSVEAFKKNHQSIIDKVIEWANKEDVFVEFGCLKNGQAYCRYHLGRENQYEVAALEGALDHLLKSEFASMRRHIISLPTIIASN